MEMATDLPSSFSEGSALKMVGYDMTKLAATRLYAKTGGLHGSEAGSRGSRGFD